MKKLVALIGVAVVAVILVMAGIEALINKHLPTPSTSAAAYTQPTLVDLVNQVRIKGGKPPLTADPLLDQAAQARIAFTVNQGIWNHVGANGEQWYSIDEQYAPNRTSYGENLARCYNSNQAVVTGWVNSPKHYAIMMGDYSKFGESTQLETKQMTDTYLDNHPTFSNCYLVAAEFSN